MSELVKIIGEELEEFKKQILEEFLSDLDAKIASSVAYEFDTVVEEKFKRKLSKIAEVIISDAEKKIKRIGRRG